MRWPEACQSCGKKEGLIFWAIPLKGDAWALCRDCRKTPTSIPDVYFDGKPEENLADGPDGKPLTFSSKSDKAAYLKSHGIMEAGDRHHGAPLSSVEMEKRRMDFVKQNNRREIRESLEKVMRMSPAQRHQEYLKVVKENQRYARS